MFRMIDSVAAAGESLFLLIGRLGIAALYVPSGWGKLTNLEGFAGSATIKGLPVPMAWAGVIGLLAFVVAAIHADAATMLARERLDAIDIASPREHHADHVRMAVAHGLPVLCQKPLAPTLADAQALIAEIGPRARLMVHENWRFRPFYRRIKSWLADGRLGELCALRIVVRSAGMLLDAAGRRPALERQ